ncbi:MAG: hypothetical protein JW846_08605 [Dehalococcoidia bacterium]|nr:hypothetical protein [Dehalococcoidia bacterium]
MRGLRRALLILIIGGGLAVLASYVIGYISYPRIITDLWGGVPLSLRSMYYVSMLLAAVGFFPFTWYILFRLEPSSTMIANRYHYGFFIVVYAIVLFASSAWMPLSVLMLTRPSAMVWLSVRSVLGAVGLASIALLWALLNVNVKQPACLYRLAVVGCLLFCFQTVILDGLLWPVYFPQ